MSKLEEKNIGVNPVIIAVTGAVVGAGLAVAGVALSDEKNRKKIAKTATTVKDDVIHYLRNTQKQLNTEKKAFENRLLADKKKVNKVVTSAKNSLHKTTKEVNDVVKSL